MPNNPIKRGFCVLSSTWFSIKITKIIVLQYQHKCVQLKLFTYFVTYTVCITHMHQSVIININQCSVMGKSLEISKNHVIKNASMDFVLQNLIFKLTKDFYWNNDYLLFWWHLHSYKRWNASFKSSSIIVAILRNSTFNLVINP